MEPKLFVGFYVKPAELRRLDELAAQLETTRSGVMRRLIAHAQVVTTTKTTAAPVATVQEVSHD